MRTKKWRLNLLIILLSFILLQIILCNVVKIEDDTANIYWWMMTGEIMVDRGVFNMWTAYPPVFPILFYIFYSFLRGNPGLIVFLWKVFNLIFLSLTSYFVYLITKKIYDKETSCVTSIGYFLINMSWFSLILVGIRSDQFEYIPIFLLVISIYFLIIKKIKTSSLFCALGALTKIFPGIVLLTGILYLKRIKNKLNFVIVFLIIIILITLPFFIANPQMFLSPYNYNLKRDGWETIWIYPEKNYAHIQEHESMFFPFDYPKKGGFSVSLFIGGALLFLLLYLLRNRIKTGKSTISMVLMLLLLLLIFSKGISSYYILWLFPLISIVYPSFTGFIINAIILLIGNLLFISDSFYWCSIFLRHIVFVLLFIHQNYILFKKYKQPPC